MSISLEKEVDRILTLLRNKIREQGYTQLEVQEKLGWGRSYISQLLTKQKSLRVEQVLLILETIKVDPEEFYAELYRFSQPAHRRSSPDVYSDDPFDDLPPDTEAFMEPAAEYGAYANGFSQRFRELRTLVHALVQTLVDKKIVTPDDIVDAARSSDPEGD